ncbi:hypothetical protein chiPu_0000058 [Chiloscyllium punctatum]|uniref:C2H2-type domain-containing protein n=1 Tax=Chiloscyllium punctatum TaxID=137246 RepID=A0A401RN82_CHIPU|nr:hypothetical protein [Chiloscyllium punctatum]
MQILKCVECGSSQKRLQQLTAHMMMTGHFLKVTNSTSKMGKQLVFDVVGEEKVQSYPLVLFNSNLDSGTKLTDQARYAIFTSYEA